MTTVLNVRRGEEEGQGLLDLPCVLERESSWSPCKAHRI